MTAPTPAIVAAGSVRQNVPLGIGLMVLGVLLFSLNDTLGKWLAGYYAAPQILLFRSISALAVLAFFAARTGFGAMWHMERRPLQIGRALLGALETGMFYLVVRYLPLADAMTFYLAGPIYVTVLAALFLGETVGWRRWSAVLVGFAGVLLALQPAASHFGWPALVALAGSLIYAVFLTVTRKLRGTPDVVMAFWQIGCGFVLGLIGTPFVYVPLARGYDLALLTLLGVVSLAAIVCVNRSISIAPASVVVPFQYLLIVWAGLFGYIFFGDVPAPATIAGAVVIVAAGFYIFIREQRLARVSELELPPDM